MLIIFSVCFQKLHIWKKFHTIYFLTCKYLDKAVTVESANPTVHSNLQKSNPQKAQIFLPPNDAGDWLSLLPEVLGPNLSPENG
jgi:hypothetical protein